MRKAPTVAAVRAQCCRNGSNVRLVNHTTKNSTCEISISAVDSRQISEPYTVHRQQFQPRPVLVTAAVGAIPDELFRRTHNMSSESQDRPEGDKQPTPPKGKGKEVKKKKKSGAFSISKLKVSADYSQSIKAERHHLRMSCRKPGKTEWVHIDTRPDRSDVFWLYEDKHQAGGKNELYLLDPAVVPLVGDEAFKATIYIAVNRQMDPFLWPCREPDEERVNEWHTTLQLAAEAAQEQWIRVRANMGVGGYEYYTLGADVVPADPVFPKETLEEMLELSFKDFYIQDADHIVVRKLEGRQ